MAKILLSSDKYLIDLCTKRISHRFPISNVVRLLRNIKVSYSDKILTAEVDISVPGSLSRSHKYITIANTIKRHDLHYMHPDLALHYFLLTVFKDIPGAERHKRLTWYEQPTNVTYEVVGNTFYVHSVRIDNPKPSISGRTNTLGHSRLHCLKDIGLPHLNFYFVFGRFRDVSHLVDVEFMTRELEQEER